MEVENVAFFFLVDVIPEYIQKTFNVTPEGRFRNEGYVFNIRTVLMGQPMPEGLSFAVIIFNDSEWHRTQLYRLMAQVKEFNPGAKILALPVSA